MEFDERTVAGSGFARGQNCTCCLMIILQLSFKNVFFKILLSGNSGFIIFNLLFIGFYVER